MTMTPIEMAEAMEGRARVRRKITNRENTGDRLSDQLEQAATMLRQQQAEIEVLKKQLAFMEGEYPEPTIMAKMMEVDLVRQQQAEIEALKEKVDELAGYKASYENCHRACNGYGMN